MTCSICGIIGHNSRTCSSGRKVLPPFFSEWVSRGLGAWMDLSRVPVEDLTLTRVTSVSPGDIIQYTEYRQPKICRVTYLSSSGRSFRKEDGYFHNGKFTHSGTRNSTNKDHLNLTRRLYKVSHTPSTPSPSPSPSPSTQLVISPISADPKNPARRDYSEQEYRVQHGLPLVWDDTSHNRARAGDRFGFWFYQNAVHVHTIISVDLPSARLPTWSENVGQGTRNVVTLSTEYTSIQWSDWIAADGAQRCMGTSHVKKGLENILYMCK